MGQLLIPTNRRESECIGTSQNDYKKQLSCSAEVRSPQTRQQAESLQKAIFRSYLRGLSACWNNFKRPSSIRSAQSQFSEPPF